MARLDKYGRKVFWDKIDILNTVNVSKKDGEDGFDALIIDSNLNCHCIAVDLEDGDRSEAITPLESPRIDALTENGIWDPAVADAFAAMLTASCEHMPTQEYVDTIIAIEAAKDSSE